MTDRELVKEIRGKCGLSQERFAARLDVSWKTIARYESGSYEIPLESLLRLASWCREEQPEYVPEIRRRFIERFDSV
jgi:DNA-binding XRE family transcriptional regulator